MQRDRRSARYVVSVLVGVFAATPLAAHAYCRTTSDPSSGACPAACTTTGIPLAWGTPEIEYALNRDTFLGPDEGAFRAALARSFDHWATVSCNGQPIGFDFAELPQRTDLTVGPVMGEPNLNVISELDADDWAALGFDEHTFAKTQLWFDQRNGEILGADIAFNRSIGDFAVCPDGGCAPGTIDLENVATHEFGHFLGLSHSGDPSSTMWCDAVKDDLQKRSLGDDDVAGLCAIYGSRSVFIDPGPKAGGGASSNPTSKSESSGCALGGKDEDQAPFVLSVLSLLALTIRNKKYRPR